MVAGGLSDLYVETSSQVKASVTKAMYMFCAT
jgi:hypothetical protein